MKILTQPDAVNALNGTNPEADPLRDLAALRAAAVEVMRRGRGSRPDVLRVRLDGNEAVLKDQNGCDPLFAKLVGPLLARREARALGQLNGLEGVPALLGRPDRRSVLMAYIPATPITRAAHDDWRAFFEALEALLAAMHARGVAHCDLRSPGNTLVDESGRPVLVDFVASFRRGRAWNPLSAWLFHLFRNVDRKALIKLKFLVAPDLVPPEQRHLLEHRSAVHRAVRGLGVGVRRLTRRLFTRSARDGSER